MDLRPGERLDDLGRGGLRIIQHPGRSSFSLDPVLLSHFVTVRKRDRVLDLGTGSGIVPLLLSALYPAVELVGLEIQPEVAEMASRSVLLNCLQGRIRVDCGDYRQITSLYGHGAFDVVTMNPPYREVGTGTLSPVEARAMARHEVTGNLETAVEAAALAVKFGGRVAVVLLADRMAELLVYMKQCNIEPKRLRIVQPRVSRAANLFLVEGVKGGGVGLKVEPPLVIYGEGQTFSDEMTAIYSSTLVDTNE